jgi:hypothetical protein
VALGQNYSEYLSFPCQSFHLLLHTHHHLLYGASTRYQPIPASGSRKNDHSSLKSIPSYAACIALARLCSLLTHHEERYPDLSHSNRSWAKTEYEALIWITTSETSCNFLAPSTWDRQWMSRLLANVQMDLLYTSEPRSDFPPIDISSEWKVDQRHSFYTPLSMHNTTNNCQLKSEI